MRPPGPLPSHVGSAAPSVSDADDRNVRNAQIFLTVSIVGAALVGLLSIPVHRPAGLGTIPVVVGLSVIVPLMSRYPHRVRLLVHIALAIGLVSVTAGALLSNVSHDPSVLTMAYCVAFPLGASYLCGTRAGFIWAVVSIVAIAGVTAATIAIGEAGQTPEQHMLSAWLLAIVVAITAGFAIAGRRMTDRYQAELECTAAELAEMNDGLERRVEARTAELAESNRRLEVALDAAESASKAKGAFVANMSHELRTPLNGVLGLSELLRDTSLTTEQESLVDALDSSGRALVDTLGSVLDFVTLEAGGIELTDHPFDPADVIWRTATHLAAAAAAKGLDFAVDCDPALPAEISGDALQLGRAVDRLLSNAVKFTPGGGAVGITAWHDTTDPGAAMFCVDVHDTGPGIAPSQLAHLWDAFAPGDDSSSKQHAGIGLGLTLVHQYATLARGRIEVTSKTGAGTTFSLRVPATGTPTTPVRLEGDPGRVAILAGPLTTRSLDRGLAVAGARPMVCDPDDDLAHFDVVVIDRTRHELAGLAVPAGIRTIELGTADGLALPVRPHELAAALTTDVAGAAGGGTPGDVSATRTGGDPRSVLIVEDNPVNRKVLTKIVATLGYDTLCAENGQDGADTYLAHHHDIAAVLMDCQMPVLDGYGATREIRHHETRTGRRCPIIAVTANALEGDREKCLAAGMDDFLAKPVDRARLAATLGHWAPLPAATTTV